MNRYNRSGEKIKDVISYADDVYAWVYLDQVDRVIRYEAFVVGYSDAGEPTTLDFVLEEGVLDNVQEVPFLWQLLQRKHPQVNYAHVPTFNLVNSGRIITPAPLKQFYRMLSGEQLQQVHAYFGQQEEKLKAERQPRWTRMLRALGYDVIPSL